MTEIAGPSLIAMLGSIVATLMSIGLDVALLFVALGPVRRHRPDVSGLLATAACILLASAVCSPVLFAIVPGLASTAGGSLDSAVAVSTATSLLVAIARAAGFAMVLAGIARLASPRRHDPREPS